MPRVYMRIIASQDAADHVISAIHELDVVERVEEVADFMSQMGEDSSSAGLPDDQGPGIHNVEVEVSHSKDTDRVRKLAEDAAVISGATVEFVESL